MSTHPLTVQILVWLGMLFVGLGVLYTLALLALSRFEPSHERSKPSSSTTQRLPMLIIVLRCLGHDEALRENLTRLLALEPRATKILVVDSHVSGGAGDVVREMQNPRIDLVGSPQPDPAQGRGRDWNTALAHLRGQETAELVDTSGVVVCLLDEGERLQHDALAGALPVFDDARVGAVELGCRADHVEANVVTRMQDMELLLRSEVFQQGRQHLGSESLGCTGQLVRLSALLSLGAAPWTVGARPELHLGVRLVLSGWVTRFVPSPGVLRAVPGDFTQWSQQRARQFHGQVQCLALLPRVVSELRGVTRRELLFRLLGPLLTIVASVLGGAAALWGAWALLGLDPSAVSASWWWPWVYLSFLAILLTFARVFDEASGFEQGAGARIRVALWMHLYAIYLLSRGLLAWWGLILMLAGRYRYGPAAPSKYVARHRRKRREVVSPLADEVLLLWKAISGPLSAKGFPLRSQSSHASEQLRPDRSRVLAGKD